jgi:hypothetical protein
MAIGRLILPAALALPAAGLAAAPGQACVFNAVACVGPSLECHPSEAERRAEERHWSAEATRLRLIEARNRLRDGEVDLAADLAELLVPNIRPIHTDFSDCGPEGEIDQGKGRETEESLFQALTAGTALAGASSEPFIGILRRTDEDYAFGTSCNAEFRQSFAGSLRRSLTAAQLRDSWLFLTARQRSQGPYGAIYHRLVSFAGQTRAPPLRWVAADVWLRGQVATALRRTAWGPALRATMDSFWAAKATELAESSRVCPAAFARWTAVRGRLVPKLLEAARHLPGESR